jgi:FkbM family methyltransferase
VKLLFRKNPFRSIANIFGYELLNLRRRQHFDIERHIAYLLDKYSINCVIDVGANIGQFGKFLRKLGYKGYIFSFEPIMTTYQKLLESSKNDNKWEVFNYALGEEDTVKDMNVQVASELSSFLKINEFGNNELGGGNPRLYVEAVQVRRLDQILPSLIKNIYAPRIYLKIDTQGYDINVVKGSSRCIKDIVILQSEMSVTPIYEGMPTYIESLSYYSMLGFTITGFYPITRDSKTCILIEFDCVMVNNREAVAKPI